MNARVSIKLVVVFALTLVILLALLAVGITINSRQSYRQEAISSIAQSYSGAQTIVGPVIAARYQHDVVTSEMDSKGVTTLKHANADAEDAFFPKLLKIDGMLVPSERHHGLYRVTVYELRTHVDAEFQVPAPVAATPYYDYSLRFSVSDLRGIVGLPTVTVNGLPIALKTGATADYSNGNQHTVLHASVKEIVAPSSVRATIYVPGQPRKVVLHMDFVLGGTEQLSIAPIGDLTEVQLVSAWPSPLFSGRFLPRTRTVDGSGFKAQWEVSSLASSAQQQTGASFMGTPETFDISLIQPTDPYKLSDRATKYGVLFVLLTFAGFFIFEVMKQLPIHPVQYLLVGFALALFFLLLISLSEHIPFGNAYLLSSIASIGLLTFYLSYVLRSVRRAAGFGALITLLFAAIYGLLLSEDNALLLGSCMLFVILAIVMVVTRRVDWYRSAIPAEAPAGPVQNPTANVSSTSPGIGRAPLQ